jgi:hypothetical protein
MNNIIESVVKETLRKRLVINEGLTSILEQEVGDDEKFDQIVNSLAALSDEEGMSDGEIETNIDEGVVDWVKQYIAPGGDKSSDASGDTSLSMDNAKSKMSSAFMSQLREWLIRKALGAIGIQGALSDALAAAMADISIAGVVQVFKGEGGCKQYGDDLADAFMEGLLTYILGGTEPNSAAFNFLRNTVGEYMKSSSMGEVVAEKICTLAYNRG